MTVTYPKCCCWTKSSLHRRSDIIISAGTRNERDIFAHWFWAVPILLIVAALSLRQIDLYLATTDEFFSMFHSGWVINSPYSPLEITESLRQYSPKHMPGFFLLLSAWGNLTGFDVATGRVLGVLAGLLSLAMAFRLGRDFVAPVAGLFAIIFMASNAYYNIYFAYVRMYSLMVFEAGLVLWLYLRISHKVKSAKPIDYIALAAAVFALVNTQAFSAGFLLMLGIYHLLFAPKKRNWWGISVSVFAAAALFATYGPSLILSGMDRHYAYWRSSAASGWQAIAIWLTVSTNGAPLLLMISVAGLCFGIWKKKIVPQPYFLLAIIFALELGLTAKFSSIITTTGMRHHLPAWLAAQLVVAAGLYAFYRFRRWLALLTLLWIIAGVLFQNNANWRDIIAGRTSAFGYVPWQVVSRLAVKHELAPAIIDFQAETLRLTWKSYIDITQLDHLFIRHNVAFEVANDLGALQDVVRNGLNLRPEIWIVLQQSVAGTKVQTELDEAMQGSGYDKCETIETGIDTLILQFAWDIRGCKPFEQVLVSQTDQISYQLFGVDYDEAGGSIVLADEWKLRRNARTDNYKLSYQLMSSNWEKVAQLDLPLEYEGKPRRYSIDTEQVPPGTYQLMAILYDKWTGDRKPWIENVGEIPDMLQLAAIDLQ